MIVIACEEVVVIDLPNKQEFIVVEGWITNLLQHQTIRITQSSGFLSSDTLRPIANGRVEVFSTGNLRHNFFYIGKGLYQSEHIFQGESQDTYLLRITINDSVMLFSQREVMNKPTEIFVTRTQSFEDINEITGELETFFFPKVFAIDSPGHKNFYQWRLYRNGMLYDEPNPIIIESDRFFDGNLIPNTFDDFFYSKGDTAVVELISISQAAFNFLQLIENQINTFGTSAVSTPSQIEGNIQSTHSTHVLGFFGTYAISRDTLIIQ